MQSFRHGDRPTFAMHPVAITLGGTVDERTNIEFWTEIDHEPGGGYFMGSVSIAAIQVDHLYFGRMPTPKLTVEAVIRAGLTELVRP